MRKKQDILDMAAALHTDPRELLALEVQIDLRDALMEIKDTLYLIADMAGGKGGENV